MSRASGDVSRVARGEATVQSGSDMHVFHPLVADWFQRRFTSATPSQLEAWPRIGAGDDVLVSAPTGSGKTLAAFLICLDRLLVAGLA